MNIPFGFGRGHYGRQLLKWTKEQLEELASIDESKEPNKCAYNLFHLQLNKLWAKSILKHKYGQTKY